MGKKGKKGKGGGGGGEGQAGQPSGSGQRQESTAPPTQEAFPSLGSSGGQDRGKKGKGGGGGGEGQAGQPSGSGQRQESTAPPTQEAFPSLGSSGGQDRGPPQQARGRQQGPPPQQQRPPHQQEPPQQQVPPQQQARGWQQGPPQQQQQGPPRHQGPPQQQQQGPPRQQGPPQQQQQGPPRHQGPSQQQQQGPPRHQGPPQQQQQGPPRQQGLPQQQQQGPPSQQGPPQQQQQGPPRQPPTASQPAQRPSPPPGDLKQMTIGYQIPKRNGRQQVPKKGHKIVVETNHLALSIKNPDMVVFHYDVAVVPERPFRFYRPALNAVQKKCYPNRFPAFDGKKNLYAYPELPIQKRELVETVSIYDAEREVQKEITVTIKFAASVNMSVIKDYIRGGSSLSTPQDAIQALDIVLRQPAANRFVTVGRSFFTKPPGRVISLGDGLDLWYGFFQSAIIGWKSYLNIDVAHKGFPAALSCLELLAEYCRCRVSDLENQRFTLDQFQTKMLVEHIKNLKVIQEIPTHNIKRTYKVIGLSECPKNNMFPCEDKVTKQMKTMSVEQYFLNTYRVRLRFPHLPCLKAGTPEKNVSLPMELCRIMEGQVTMKKMNEVQTRNMVKEAAVDTERRKMKIVQSMAEVKFNQDPCIREFGLSVSDNFTKVDARILPAPTVDYKDKFNRSIIKAKVDKGVWRINDCKFLIAAEVSKWCILNTNRRVRDDELRNLAEGLTKYGRECGLNISEQPQITMLEQPVKIEDFFRTCHRNEMKLIVVVLPERGVTYATIKKMAELQVGVLTQCLKSITVQRRANQSTFVNILQKINAKLNGVNHNITPELWPAFFKTPVMVVGADVTHPAPDQSFVPSIAAVAASHDPRAFKYNMIWKLQPPRVEVIAELKSIMVEQLKFFYKTTRYKPEKILFYRDGVSEGQFRQILDVELRSIREACQTLSKEYKPAITFLVVQKRHHTRFFPSAKDADGRNKNVPAGTVVDTEITHPTELDFYLVSHASIQGTARPTKYHVLWDDANMSEQELEEITYYLCHLFTRCTRSVSYPAPTYYAHLAAFRARSYTDPEGSQRLNLDALSTEQERRQVKTEIITKNPMFFV